SSAPHCSPPSFPTRRSSDLGPSWIESAALQSSSDPWIFSGPGPSRSLIAMGATTRRSDSRLVRSLVNKRSIGLRDSLVMLFRLRSEEHTSELQSLRHLVCRL